jgi:hypothetical protein
VFRFAWIVSIGIIVSSLNISIVQAAVFDTFAAGLKFRKQVLPQPWTFAGK